MAEKKLSEVFELYADKIQRYAKKIEAVSPETVFQQGVPEIQLLINEILDKVVAPDSSFKHSEYLDTFLQSVKEGKNAVILPEHYSNFDYPILLYLLKKSGDAGVEIANRCVAIAGMKLTEESPAMGLITQAYTRINIYPSRTLESITDESLLTKEKKRSRAINIASMRALKNAKADGKIIVVFPTGTRYRPGKPETKRGLREIDSYLKSFDIMMPVSINGNCLRLSEDAGDMLNDRVVVDTITMEAAKPCATQDFRSRVLAEESDSDDPKQAVVDRLMSILEEMHLKNEKA